MPFVRGGTRNETQLTAFFNNHLKRSIENAQLQFGYRVDRSGQAFDITTEIIRDICRADIVIADLSGEAPNPNVMYELGVRLAVSELPVILIREKIPENRRIFDIYGFFTFEYDPYDYVSLEEHLITKIASLENGAEPYDNPVLRLIREQTALMAPDPTALAPERQKELVLHGIRFASDAVERAYGPHGSALAVDSTVGDTILIRRGGDLLKNVVSSNPFEARGVRLLADAAQQMHSEMGDGSKLPVLLARSIIENGLDAIRSGLFPPDLMRGIDQGVEAVSHSIRALSLPVGNKRGDVARTAAKNARFDLDKVGLVLNRGANDLVLIEDGGFGAGTLEVTVSEGFEFDRGPVTPDFIPHGRVELTDCLVLLYAHRVSHVSEILPILSEIAKLGQSLLVVADDVEGEALATLILNRHKGTLNAIPVKAPSYGGRRPEVMQDLAVYTGAEIVSNLRGYTLLAMTTGQLGRAERVVIEQNRTVLIGGGGRREEVSAREEMLRAQIQATINDYDREMLRVRLARLSGRMVTVTLRGGNPNEVRQRRYELEAALDAVTRANLSGCVPGGGTALIRAKAAIEAVPREGNAHSAGLRAVSSALEAPLRTLVKNTGRSPDEVVAQVLGNERPNIGFNAASSEVADVWEAGIIDPSAVLARAVEIAGSTARMFLEAGSWAIGSKLEPDLKL
jgi:chaperonin GroEL